jgi:hypothetical protein
VTLRLVESCEDDDERRVTTMAETKRMTTEEVVGYLSRARGWISCASRFPGSCST